MPTSRIPTELAARFGLLAIGTLSRVSLPLKGVECAFSVRAGLVEVNMTQIFRQENRQPLDCDYLFPLPADASVFCCEADINGRIIRAKVRERQEALQLAAEKKAEGRRVALVEAERENLFTLTLNNLQPDDLILVTLSYIQPLRSLADMPSVEIPFCPGIRYIPGSPLLRSNRGKGIVDDTNEVPDASRISPVRIDPHHPDAAFVEIRGRLDAEFIDAASVMSPSHNVISAREADSLTVRLSDKGEVPDRDFVLRWKELKPAALAARAWIHGRENETYALMEIRAPKASGTPEPMDFYFLVDRSGSMSGVKWEKAALAVQSSLQSLLKGDRAMVTLFSSGWNDFAEQPLPPQQLLADKNFSNLAQLPPAGGTALGPALQHVLEIAKAHSSGRSKSLILITDAQVGNEDAILALMGPAPDFPLHCFGVDVNLNDALLLALARQQRGTFHSLNPGDDVAKAVTNLAQTIRHPVLRDLRLPDTWEAAEAWLPPLYSSQVYYLSARTAGKAALALSARNGTEAPAQIPVACQTAAGNAPYLHWCKNRIQRYISERRTAEAIALSVQSNLVCPLTAFIAWDESEKVAVASHTLAQPAFEDLAMLAPAATLAGSGRSAVMGVRPSFAPGRETRALRAECMMESRPPVAKDPPDRADRLHPFEVVRTIVQHLNDPGIRHHRDPFTIEERRATFDKVLEEFRTRLSRPDWKPLCDQILAWAFADAKDAVVRSNQLAQFLSGLISRLGDIFDARERLQWGVGQLRSFYLKRAEQFEQVQPLLRADALDLGALANLLAGWPDLFADERIRKPLSRLERIISEIEQQLAGFVASASAR
jgi:Ca-activated chloride channel homolog